MAQDTRLKTIPDGFVCAGCNRTSYHMSLAPYCYRCREEMDIVKRNSPRVTSGWRLMFWFMWDAIFHRGYDKHMQRAMELSNRAYAKWDQDNTPSHPPKDKP